MANKHTIQTKAPQPRRVVMVVYPQAHILDVVGPLEVLTGAKLFLPEGVTPYEVHVVAESAGRVSTTSGLTIEAIESPALLDFVQQTAKRAGRIVSICIGG